MKLPDSKTRILSRKRRIASGYTVIRLTALTKGVLEDLRARLPVVSLDELLFYLARAEHEATAGNLARRASSSGRRRPAGHKAQ